MYKCVKCKKTYPLDTFEYRCECGGLFDLDYHLNFEDEDINTFLWSQFRYAEGMPFVGDAWKRVSLGEGMTPLIAFDDDYPNILAKGEYMMPTLSFKDRGAVMLIAMAKKMGVKKVVQDSSGNAGNAVAAYAGRAGIECEIFVPEGTSEKKIKMIKAHGAVANVVPGTREDTQKATLDKAGEGDVFYASHVFNPFFYQGTKTYLYEIYEQMGGKLPDNLVIPVGNGTLFFGVYLAVREMLENHWIKETPKVILVQAEGCSPIYEAFVKNLDEVTAVKNTGTDAEGIAIAMPLRGNQILAAIRELQGQVILGYNEDVKGMRDDLAKKGYYVEPTTAATFAGFYKYMKENQVKGTTVIPLCGAGLKK